jgi:oligoribonuclease (3'-5' exoribonuclease)
MKYVSIDLETTGLETENHQVLSIGAVIEDTLNPHVKVEDLPTFHGVIVHNELTGSPFALNMNRDLIEKISVWQNTKPEGRKEFEQLTSCNFTRSRIL